MRRGVTVSLDERRLVRALRAGEETAYARLHELYDARLVELAVAHGCSRAVAQEVVQETWTAVVRNIQAFEGRSSLKTWIFRILVNAANAHAARERRSMPVAPEVVVDLDDARSRRRTMPPDEQLVLRETVASVHAAIGQLTPSQRHVITLRDVHGWTAEDVSGELGISRGHQRVLLHRARAHVRRSLSAYFGLPSEAAA
jgi:RNA polymerase sigma-70 factor (ECF subfamily)